MSKSFCRLSQSCAVVPSALASRSAVSAVTPIRSLAIRSIRVRGKPQTLARAPADIFSGTRNSSRRTSPGCMGLSFLPIAIARQSLKTVAWRRPQVAEIARGAEVAQFPARHLDQIGRKALRTFAVEDGFGGLVPEAPDHRQCVSFNDTAIKVRVSINDTASARSIIRLSTGQCSRRLTHYVKYHIMGHGSKG